MSKGVWYIPRMPVTSPATQWLDHLSIPYRVFTHTHLPATLEDAARDRGQQPNQIIRSILFRLPGHVFVMVLIAGPGQISWKHLRAYLGVSRISMATDEEVQRVTGYEIGTVNPFGLPSPLRVLIDESVFQSSEISLGCGVRGSAIILQSTDLRRALGHTEAGIFSA